MILVHGAGVRANIFRPPVDTTFADFLVARGYDVWLENWRASIDLAPNEWTLDKAAAYDHPEAVRKVVEQTGADEIKAVIHCQGATSFMMSAVAGLVPEVKTIVANAVTLHPVVPRLSQLKGRFILPIVSRMTAYVDPRWGNAAEGFVAKAMAGFVKATHHECDNAVCKMVSFTYGSGFPALWGHDNLNAETHRWLSDEFGHVPLSFFRQMVRCTTAGHLVSVDESTNLPASFVAEAPKTDARIAFVAGSRNLCFLPESQVRSFEYFSSYRPSYHSLQVFPRYGHLDIFMGHRASREVFPVLAEELDR